MGEAPGIPMGSEAPAPPLAEDLEPWWLTAGQAAQETGALWSFDRVLGLRRHRSSVVKQWAKRHLTLAVAPIAVETLREVLEEPDEELAAWAALHLGVAGASGVTAAAGAAPQLYRRMVGSAGRLQGACAEALGWLGHQEAAEPMLRWAARGRDVGARTGVMAGLGRMRGCAEPLAELVEQAEDPWRFTGLAVALLEHRRPGDLERVDCKAQGARAGSPRARREPDVPAGERQRREKPGPGAGPQAGA